MASDPRELHSLRSPDSANAVDHPLATTSSSASSAASDRKVKLLCSYGGQILPRLTDGALRYAGGETRLITVRRDSSLPEILRRMAEAYGGPVVLRYQLPDVDLDALISVSTAEDLEHMMEECDRLAAQSSSAKLRVFLLSPSKVSGTGADSLAPFHDLQDTGARYIEAVNGLDSSMMRKDSVASFTSTQYSDGMNAVEAVVSEDVQDLPPATSSSDQNLISAQFESHLLVTNQDELSNSTKAELISVEQPLINPHHGQLMNSQSYPVTGLPPEIDLVSVAQSASVPPSNNDASAHRVSNEASVQTKMDLILENPNSGRTVKFPGDAKLQPLSQLPPLPPPHLLAPYVEQQGLRQLPLAQSLAMRLEDCNLCHRGLPHAHSDTLINEQGNGLRNAIPEARAALQSHLSEDFTRRGAPQRVDMRTPVDKWVESQAQNLLASDPFVTYEFSETIPEMPLGPERPVIQDAVHPNQSKVLVSPFSLGWPDTSQLMYGTMTNPQKSLLDESVQKPEEVPLTWNPTAENFNLSNLLAPTSLAQSSNPYGTSIVTPQSHGQDALHQQFQLSQHIGFSNFPANQDPINKPFVADGSVVENSEFQDGQSVHGTVPAFFYGNIGPMDGMMGALYTNPLRAPKMLVDEQPTAVREIPYPQNVQPVNASHILTMAGIHGPQSYHLEAGVGPGVSMDVGAFKNNPSSQWKNEASNFHPVELLGDLTVSQNDNSQFCTVQHASNTDQMQQAVSSDPLVRNNYPQEILGINSALPPTTDNVYRKPLVATNALYDNNYLVDGIRSQITVPTEGVSLCPQDSKNMNSSTNPIQDAEDVRIKPHIQTFDDRSPAFQSSEVPESVLISHETKETSPSSNKEIDDDQTETIVVKQTEKVKNGGFPNTDDIGHLQVINNSDLEELQELGSGAFGTVYHGKWRGTDVAIKRINDRIFSEKSSEQERARADFWNEACKLASLHHPNVVAFYGIVLDGPAGSIATLTEYMVNGSLRRVLQKNEKILDKYQRLLIAMDVAFGMEYLHSKNIIHFDLKSDNLLVNWRDPQRPICKVGDLGLAKVKYETLMSGGMRGTLPWMAPELLGGKENKYTEKIDVFSFGIVMWELFTGREPYGDMHYGAIIGGILSDTLRPPVPESCDDEWRLLMEQCWATEPSQRPSFTDIASRLRAMAA
ncbi:hypothetical protein Cni_G27865 [Canna indica]|uniref:Protein kinase domain-containing protein n=1 Tax=Canna indica TaxID=4628 RepID=A0AAQ3L1L0_9LILI|nr:hypothetical protein Cni_G27865 [Canna indica]